MSAEEAKLTAQNLVKLADWVEANLKQEQIEMKYLRSEFNPDDGELEGTTFRSKDECGSCGCMLGWAPFVPGLEPIAGDYVACFYPEYLVFNYYGRRIFPALYVGWDTNKDWEAIFSQDLENDKESLVAGIRAKAEELELR